MIAADLVEDKPDYNEVQSGGGSLSKINKLTNSLEKLLAKSSKSHNRAQSGQQVLDSKESGCNSPETSYEDSIDRYLGFKADKSDDGPKFNQVTAFRQLPGKSRQKLLYMDS